MASLVDNPIEEKYSEFEDRIILKKDKRVKRMKKIYISRAVVGYLQYLIPEREKKVNKAKNTFEDIIWKIKIKKYIKPYIQETLGTLNQDKYMHK